MDYLKDDELMNQLEGLGHDIKGYLYTEACNVRWFEKGKWDDLLEKRKNRLNKEIKYLIQYIKAKY